jgi:hypothetical protein
MKKIYISGAIFLSLLIAAVLIWSFSSKEATRYAAPEPIAIATSSPDLKTYKNADFGISFKYPGSYNLIERNGGNSRSYEYSITLTEQSASEPTGTVPGEVPISIAINIYQNSLDRLTPAQWVASSSDSNYTLASKPFDTMLIGGKNAVTYSWSGLYQADTAVYATNGSIVSATATYISPKDRTKTDFWGTILPSLSFEAPNRSAGGAATADTAVEEKADAYLRAHIGKLAIEKAVLGGTFYVTSVVFSENPGLSKSGTIKYEDGHNAFKADFDYVVDSQGNVSISNFKSADDSPGTSE